MKDLFKNLNFNELINGLSNPFRLFGIVAIVVCTIFTGFSVLVTKENADSFMYCLHIFMAIMGLFGSIALFSPATLYNPQELACLEEGDRPKHAPLIPAIIMIVVLILYMAFQCIMDGPFWDKKKCTECKTEIVKIQQNKPQIVLHLFNLLCISTNQ